MPRVNPLIGLAMVTGLIFALVLGADTILHLLSGLLFVYLLLAVLFDLWESQKR